MGKKTRRNRKKNPKQFKINQENAIKKDSCASKRTKGHMLVNYDSKRLSGQAKSGLARELKGQFKTMLKDHFSSGGSIEQLKMLL